MATRKRKPKAPRLDLETARVRHLLSLDAGTVMKRLISKQDEAVALFSRNRTREPLTELCRSHFTSISFSDLSRLTPHEQKAVYGFHDVLHQLRWYVSWTEDMPSTVKATVSQYVRRLDELHHLLRTTIGPPEGDGHPVIDGQISPS